MIPLDLPVGPLTLPEVWAALPPARRQPALDYWQQGEPYARLRRGFHLLGCLRGHRDWYTVEVRPEQALFLGACTCGRRGVCAHLGALLVAWAEDPGGFRLWDTIRPDLGDAAWEWARGTPFPWTLVVADDGPWTRPPREPFDLDRHFGGLEQAAPDVLRRRLQSCHPDWWTVPEFTARAASLLRAVAGTGLARPTLIAWADTAGMLPEGLLYPLWALPQADDPAIEARLLMRLFEAVGHAVDAAAGAATTQVRRLAAHTADWYAARGRWADGDAVWARVASVADPYRLAAAEWLFRHGRLAEARGVLHQAPLPPDVRRQQARQALERLINAASAEPGPGSE